MNVYLHKKRNIRSLIEYKNQEKSRKLKTNVLLVKYSGSRVRHYKLQQKWGVINMIKLKDITTIKNILRSESYDKILIWKDGSWDLSSSGYSGEQDGVNPVIVLNRVLYVDLTYRQIDELIKNIKEQLNN